MYVYTKGMQQNFNFFSKLIDKENAMITQVIGKNATVAGVILLVILKFIVVWQHVSLARTLTRNLSRISARDIRLANLRPWYNSSLWSPDGQWIAGASLTEGLYIRKADSSSEQKYLGNAGVPRREVAWSWDSKKLFYQVNLPIEVPPFTRRWIESVDIETGKVTEHPELSIFDDLDSVARARYPSDPILSLNFKDNVIEARTKDGSRRWQVTPNPVLYLSTLLSPDKKKVLVDGYVYATDGSGLLADLGRDFFGSWSPDGTKILYTIEDDNGHTITASDLYVINTDGTGKKQLTDTPDKLERDPRWSPDGTKVVFYSGLLHSESTSVYIADIVVETE